VFGAISNVVRPKIENWSAFKPENVKPETKILAIPLLVSLMVLSRGKFMTTS
jgi:hypothetical protein